MMHHRVTVVTAMPREAAALDVRAIAVGTRSRAGEAARDLLRRDGTGVLLIAGVCGGLDPALRAGDLIVGRRVVSPRGEELWPDAAMFEAASRALRNAGVRFASSSLLTQDDPSADSAERSRLGRTHDAAGADMETFDIARAAAAEGVPWLALRAVVDTADEELPPSLKHWSGESDATVVLRALRRPLEWPAYVRLAFQMRHALHTLRRATAITARAVSAG
jgi:adenosylhomocysteine nucleosidase